MGQKYNYILVVDDNAGIRRLLFEILTEDGYNVEVSSNGFDAIEKVRKRIPSLVLLDARMPRMNGFETLNEIKKIDQLIPVIMITAYTELKIVEKAREDQLIKHFAKKPFDIEKLMEMIKNILSSGNDNGQKSLSTI
jgi:two-component system response regulator (stage 0 sporulation protein F)